MTSDFFKNLFNHVGSIKKSDQQWFNEKYSNEEIINIIGTNRLKNSLKIEDFTKLKSINLKKLKLTSLEIIKCPQLTRVDLSELIRLESLFVSKCSRLT